MCIVSNIGDYWVDGFKKRYPTSIPQFWELERVKRQRYEEIDISLPLEEIKRDIVKLRLEMEELKALLKQAKSFDENTGQPGCELEEKIALIKKIGELVGVNFDEVFKSNNAQS